MRKPAPAWPQRTIIGGSTASRLAAIRAYSDRRGGALKEMTDGHRPRSLGNRRDEDKNPAKSSTLALTSLPCCSKMVAMAAFQDAARSAACYTTCMDPTPVSAQDPMVDPRCAKRSSESDRSGWATSGRGNVLDANEAGTVSRSSYRSSSGRVDEGHEPAGMFPAELEVPLRDRRARSDSRHVTRTTYCRRDGE